MKCTLLSMYLWQAENSTANLVAVKSYRQRLQARDLCLSVATFMVILVAFRQFPAVLIRARWHIPFLFFTFLCKRITKWPEGAWEMYTEQYVDLGMGVLFFYSAVNVTQRSVSWIITLELDWMQRFLWISTTNVMSTQRNAGGFGFGFGWPLNTARSDWNHFKFLCGFEANCIQVCWIGTLPILSA